MKMHLKMSFAKWRPFCFGLNVLRGVTTGVYLTPVFIVPSRFWFCTGPLWYIYRMTTMVKIWNTCHKCRHFNEIVTPGWTGICQYENCRWPVTNILPKWQFRYIEAITEITLPTAPTVHTHDDVIKWKHFPRYWPFMRGIHRSPMVSLTKTSDSELWCFLWSAPEQMVEQTIETPVIWDAIALLKTALLWSKTFPK